MSSDNGSNEGKTEKCNRTNRCSETSCENIFNHLDYFFGEDSQYSAHPCFANWLMKKVQNVDELQKINRDDLRKRIMKCSKFRYTLAEDEEFIEWWKEWKMIGPDGKLAHTQEFFRMVLSDTVSEYYYSFCNGDIAEDDSDWHCRSCKTCHDWHIWRCQNCHHCTYGVTSPCERCGNQG